MAERITPREKDFSQWYLDIINHAKLADQAPVRGCTVLRPNGFAIWEVVQRELNKQFEATGHRNASFPLFIPESFLNKEKEHVKGFAPECAVVTHGGGKKLDEPLIVRPTSETIINFMYSKWVKSYRDLPILINQWANVVRWELRTKPFLRTLEFLWQEGHTCHETEEEAKRETLKMLDIYRQFVENVFAIPTIQGEKTPQEKFAGAMQTYTIETMMQDTKALQSATSHYFGTRFAKAFDIKFQGRDGKMHYVYQTSWGMSTRIVGALIMTHSDDQGLVLPPKAAPTPIVIVPILQKGKENSRVLEMGEKFFKDLKKDYRVEFDDRQGYSPGYKFTEWEVQGIPLRIELGPRDLEEGTCMLAKRIGKKVKARLEDVVVEVPKILASFQKDLYLRAKKHLEANTHTEDKWSKFKERLESEGGLYHLHWCGKDECERKIKEETKATIRCVPFDQIRVSGECIYCQRNSGGRVLFAKNY